MSPMLFQIPIILIPKNHTDKSNTTPTKLTMSIMISVNKNTHTRLITKANITNGRRTLGTCFEYVEK